MINSKEKETELNSLQVGSAKESLSQSLEE